MKNLIVTLLSDQTIPNVQFIKEKQNGETVFLFVSTSRMEEKGVRIWIQKVCDIPVDMTITKIIDQFSSTDIENKLSEINYDSYDKIIVNVTGGTKIMSHFVTEFFKEKPDAEIYYLTGTDNNILQVFPKTKQSQKAISCNITLKEYVESHGFEINEGKMSGINADYSQGFLSSFLGFSDNERTIVNKLRDYRNKNSFKVSEIDGLLDILCAINFPTNDYYLTIRKNQIKYLTGDWFEEYIYHRLKSELNLSDDYIKTGITLTKGNTANEFDVVFLWNGKLYTIECKTSIKNKTKDGEQNILNDTIYKATALQKNLGLYSIFSICTLSSKENGEVRENHLTRGKLFNIEVFCKEDIITCQSIAKLLKLKQC